MASILLRKGYNTSQVRQASVLFSDVRHGFLFSFCQAGFFCPEEGFFSLHQEAQYGADSPVDSQNPITAKYGADTPVDC